MMGKKRGKMGKKAEGRGWGDGEMGSNDTNKLCLMIIDHKL